MTVDVRYGVGAQFTPTFYGDDPTVVFCCRCDNVAPPTLRACCDRCNAPTCMHCIHAALTTVDPVFRVTGVEHKPLKTIYTAECGSPGCSRKATKLVHTTEEEGTMRVSVKCKHCKEEVHASRMRGHIETECAKVPCIGAGCNWTGHRKDVAKHQEECLKALRTVISAAMDELLARTEGCEADLQHPIDLFNSQGRLCGAGSHDDDDDDDDDYVD